MLVIVRSFGVEFGRRLEKAAQVPRRQTMELPQSSHLMIRQLEGPFLQMQDVKSLTNSCWDCILVIPRLLQMPQGLLYHSNERLPRMILLCAILQMPHGKILVLMLEGLMLAVNLLVNLTVMLLMNKLFSSPHLSPNLQIHLRIFLRCLTDCHLDVMLVRCLVVPVAFWALQRRVAHQRRLYLVALH